jgi:hypothetical protein
MSYSLKKSDEAVISLYIPTFLYSAFTVTVTKLQAKTYTWGVATSDISASTEDGTLTDGGSATYTISAAGTYLFTATDGVFKFVIATTIAGVGSDTYNHYSIINSNLKSLIKTNATNILYCHPEVAYDCIAKQDDIYNTNILIMIGLAYMQDDINVAFDYTTKTAGVLYKGYSYQCTNIGAGGRDFGEGATLLLMDSNFNLVPVDTALTLNEIYTCINTGTPDAWGSTILTPLTTPLSERFKLIADSIDRVTQYESTCSVKNICQC